MNETRLAGVSGMLIYIIAGLIGVFVLLPLVVVIALSFSNSPFATFPPHGFTFKWYASVLSSPDFQRSLSISAILALAATISSLLLGVSASFALARWKVPLARTIESLLLAPMIFPVLITGVALLQFFSTIRLQSAPWTLYFAHVVITMPYVVRTVSASLKIGDISIEEAARTLGATPLTVFRRVTLPRIAPGIVTGALFAFMISFDDYPVSMWLADTQTLPLPVYLFDQMSRTFDPSIATMSSIMTVIAVVSITAMERLVGLRKAMGI